MESQADPEYGDISQEPVNILFNPDEIAKSDIWSIDLVGILDVLVRILEKTGSNDFRIAGVAALSSSLIYRMKADSIFALQKMAMDKKAPTQRRDVDIKMLGIPYRHESTYPVTLKELLGLLENIIGSLANPQNRFKNQGLKPLEPPPSLDDFVIPFGDMVDKYKDLIIKKLGSTGSGLLSQITSGLGPIDSIRCFFAILFLAMDQKIDIEQEGTDIRVRLLV